MATSRSYAASNPPLSKENLWMERFPDDNHKESEDHLYKKVGAVLVLPNDMSYAIDCSRNGVHAVARLIMAHPKIPEYCKVFVSRKPCSFCTKLLVQAKVERVFYLPIEPEYFPMKKLNKEDAERLGKCYESEKLCVDNMFKVSPIGETIFVLKVGSEVVTDVRKKFDTPEKNRDEMAENLRRKYRDPSSEFREKEHLPWPSLDEKMKREVDEHFDDMMKWMATILVEWQKGYSFELKRAQRLEKNSFDPRKENEGKQAYHFMILAKFLAERTDQDDPKTGVGAVIINTKKDIVGLGWNGFPKKRFMANLREPRTKIKAYKTRSIRTLSTQSRMH